MQPTAGLTLLSRAVKDAEDLRMFIEANGGFAQKQKPPKSGAWDDDAAHPHDDRKYGDGDRYPSPVEQTVNLMAEMVTQAKAEVQAPALDFMMSRPTIENMKGDDKGLYTLHHVLNDTIPYLASSGHTQGLKMMGDLRLPKERSYVGGFATDMCRGLHDVPLGARSKAVGIIAQSPLYQAWQEIDPKRSQNYLIEMIDALLPPDDPRHLGKTQIARRIQNSIIPSDDNKVVSDEARLLRLPDDRKGRPVLGLVFGRAVQGTVEGAIAHMDASLGGHRHNMEKGERAWTIGEKREAAETYQAEQKAQLATRRALTGLFGEVATRKEQDDPKLAAELRRLAGLMRPEIDRPSGSNGAPGAPAAAAA